MSAREYPPGLLARAALSRLFEPSDRFGQALVLAAGPEQALRIASGEARAGTVLLRELSDLLEHNAGCATLMAGALARWGPRRRDLAPERDLAVLARMGGHLLTPELPGWPEALADLELAAPLCLWVRGKAWDIPAAARMVSVVGSRDSTQYGASVSAELASGLSERGFTIVSGGAYGIDAHAHRAALSGSRGGTHLPTIAVMAGGVDRYYPAGNEELLRNIAAEGLILSEVPPGSAPTRWRFLQRNRLIAALSAVTVVVEARWRSGALSTAHHAAMLGRGVGAVPGSVHSANSAGCHRLLRDGSAVCLTDAAEAAELAGPIGSVGLAAEQDAPVAVHDGLNVEDILLLDALPVRSASGVDKLATVAGLDPRTVLSGLGRLEAGGLAERAGDGRWRRAAKS